MKKTMYCIAMLILGSFVLAGCFGKSTSSKVSLSTDDADFSSAMPQNPNSMAAKSDVFTIRVFSIFKGSIGSVYQFKAAVEAQYKMKYPKATIQWDEQEAEQWFRSNDKLTKEFTEKRADDVIFNNSDVSKFVKDGYLLDLSDRPWVANLRSNIKETLSFNGKVYGGSMGVGTAGVWYNKDIFSNLNLNIPNNWAEFLALCAKLKAGGVDPLSLAIYPDYASSYFGYLALTPETLSNPNFELNLHRGIGKINGPEYQGVLKKFVELSKNGYLGKSPVKLYNTAAMDFLTGKAAMTMDMSYLPFRKDGEFGKTNINMGFFPIPDENGNSILYSSQDYKMYINSTSKQIRQSQDLVDLFMSPGILKIFAKETGLLPASTGVTVDYEQPELKDALNWVNKLPGSTLFWWGDYLPVSTRQAIGDAVISIAEGKPYSDNLLDIAQKNFDKDKGTVVLPE